MAAQNQKNIPPSELLALILSGFYLHSVLTVAHHTSQLAHNLDAWATTGPVKTVDPPALPILVIGLLLAAYSLLKSKLKPSAIIVIALTVFATSSIFWVSGLRTNFYF
jgi:hypothetical protein